MGNRARMRQVRGSDNLTVEAYPGREGAVDGHDIIDNELPLRAAGAEGLLRAHLDEVNRPIVCATVIRHHD